MTEPRYIEYGDGYVMDAVKIWEVSGRLVGRYVAAHPDGDWDARPPGLTIRRVEGGFEVYSAARENMPELVFGTFTLAELRA